MKVKLLKDTIFYSEIYFNGMYYVEDQEEIKSNGVVEVLCVTYTIKTKNGNTTTIKTKNGNTATIDAKDVETINES